MLARDPQYGKSHIPVQEDLQIGKTQVAGGGSILMVKDMDMIEDGVMTKAKLKATIWVRDLEIGVKNSINLHLSTNLKIKVKFNRESLESNPPPNSKSIGLVQNRKQTNRHSHKNRKQTNSHKN